MHRLTGLVVGTALAATASLVLPAVASAHALPQSATPAQGAEVLTAPTAVQITFGETPDPRLSSIVVVNASGTVVDAGPTAPVPGHPLELEVPLKPIGTGVYTVTWRTVSEVDGHLATGAYAFGVGVSATGASAHASSSVVSPPPSVLAVLGRWLYFAGLMGIAGVASTCLIALRGVPRFAPRLLCAAWIAVGLGAAGVVASEAEAAGAGWGAVFSTSLGATVIERVVALALTGAGVAVVLIAPERMARLGVTGAGAGALVSMWVDVAASHAGAQAPVAANLLLQWAHIAAGGVWVGGLVTLLLAVRGQPSATKAAAVRRFSAIALVAIVVVALTGTFRAVIEIGTVGRLFGTAFGVLVVVKVALFLVLAGLGAINRWGSVPRAAASLGRLRRVASTEVVAGVAVVVVASALVNVAPPIASGSAATTANAPQLVVTGADFATTVRARLTVSPGTAGVDHFSVRVTGYDSGAIVRAKSVQLEFTQPLRPQLGESTLTLERQGDGTFAARGGNLSLDGIWEVAVIIENGAQSTEVHLQLTTITPPPLVTATRFAGLPTLYSINLQHGWIAQVYIDPDRAGAAEFHVTFFANANETSELQMATATVGMTTPGGTPRVLVVRRLDTVGHFVADATVPAAATRFDVIATTASGQEVTTYMVITPGS